MTHKSTKLFNGVDSIKLTARLSNNEIKSLNLFNYGLTSRKNSSYTMVSWGK